LLGDYIYLAENKSLFCFEVSTYKIKHNSEQWRYDRVQSALLYQTKVITAIQQLDRSVMKISESYPQGMVADNNYVP